MMQKALKHLEAGQLAEAEALYRQEIESNPQNAEAMFMLSRVRHKAGDLDEALVLLKDAEQLEPFNPHLCHARGVMHINRQEPEAAAQAFQQALDIDPSHAAARAGQAFLELAAGRPEAAVHAADRVLADDPRNVQALTYMGTALLEQGESRKAIPYLQEALRLEPEALTAQAQLGRAFLAEGKAAFAVQCFENALQQAPGAPELLEFLGRAQLDMGEVRQALKPLREAVEKGRANPELYLALATSETANGRPDRGEALLRAALKMDQGTTAPRLHLVLPLAELLLARDAAQEAGELLEPLQAQGGDDEMLWILLSRARLLAGDETGAIAAIKPRAERAGASDAARLAYVEILDGVGEAALAQEVLDALLEQAKPSLEVLFYRAKRAQQADDPGAVEWLQSLVNQAGLGRRRLLETRRLLAGALHRQGRYPEAAGQFQALAHQDAEVMYIDADLQDSDVDARSAMQVSATAGWSREPLGHNDPVFIIAWPGSGQERVLPALSAHSGVQLLLDRGASQAGRRARIDRPRGADALAWLDDTQIALRRNRYRKALAQSGYQEDDRILIDGMWLTVEALPTIARLFPAARVLVLRRDPRDMRVAWMMSGYRNRDLMADRYAQQLELLERCREALPLNFIDLDFESLDADPASGLAGLQEALGLAPEDGVLEQYAATAPGVPLEEGAYRNYADTDNAIATPDSDAIH